jgi:TonB family protein
MKRFIYFLAGYLAIAVSLLCACDESSAQNADNANSPAGVALVELFRPTYPPLARQTRISGDVDLELEIRKDGSVESVAVISGHPVLAQTAVDSVRRSRFECRKCGEPLTYLRLSYTFQLVEGNGCCATTDDVPKKSAPSEQIPRVTQ